MKNKLFYIEADKQKLKLHFVDGGHTEKMNYIDALNFIYGYQLATEQKIKVVPSDLLLAEKDLNSIISNLDKYFSTILDYRPQWKKDIKDFNNQICCGFDIYGQSELFLVKQYTK